MEYAVLVAKHLSGAAEPRPVDLGAEPEQWAIRDQERAHRRHLRAPGKTVRVWPINGADALRAVPRIRPGDTLPSHAFAQLLVHVRARRSCQRRVSGGTQPGKSGEPERHHPATPNVQLQPQ